ncbi:MAG: tetratricopeptide repeat protein, partial [Candidatus Anammoxibacter sp.]
ELGKIAVVRNKYDESLEYYKQIVKLGKANAEVLYRIGVAYDYKKQFENAVDYFKKAIDKSPGVSRYYHSLGFTYESMENREDAVACFKKALEFEDSRKAV